MSYEAPFPSAPSNVVYTGQSITLSGQSPVTVNAGRATGGYQILAGLGSTTGNDFVMNQDSAGGITMQQGGTTYLAANQSRLNLTPATNVLQIGGTQVVQQRVTGWSASSNGTRGGINGFTATLAQTSGALAQLLIDLATHGLIGP